MSTNTTTATVAPAAKKNAPAKIELPANLNVSQTIRALSDAGLTRGDIVRYFNQHLNRDIRYQHVRNVLITPVKKK